jgi:hypothetical protein
MSKKKRKERKGDHFFKNSSTDVIRCQEAIDLMN